MKIQLTVPYHLAEQAWKDLNIYCGLSIDIRVNHIEKTETFTGTAKVPPPTDWYNAWINRTGVTLVRFD